VKWITSIPVIPRILFDATSIAFCAAASQESGEAPINSMTFTTLNLIPPIVLIQSERLLMDVSKNDDCHLSKRSIQHLLIIAWLVEDIIDKSL